MMQIEQLKYLTELYKTLSITKAAENLFVSQSAISKSLSGLEDKLGVVLYKGTRSGVTFTKIGKEIAIRSQKTMKEIECLELDLAKFSRIETDIVGSLSVAGFPEFLQIIIPNTIGSFLTNFPNVKLLTHYVYANQIEKAFSPDAFDVAIVAWDEKLLAAHPQFDQLEKVYIDKLKVCIAMDAKHPLCDRNVLQPEEAASFQWICGSLAEAKATSLDYIYKDQSIHVALTTHSLDIAFQVLLDSDYLFATTNLSASHPLVKSGKIIFKPLSHDLTLELGCLYFKDSPKKDLINLFINQISIG